jgi:hypothetical protein
MSRARARNERPAITISPSIPHVPRAWAACSDGYDQPWNVPSQSPAGGRGRATRVLVSIDQPQSPASDRAGSTAGSHSRRHRHSTSAEPITTGQSTKPDPSQVTTRATVVSHAVRWLTKNASTCGSSRALWMRFSTL